MQRFNKLTAKFLVLIVSLGSTTFFSSCNPEDVAFAVGEVAYVADIVADDYLYYYGDDGYYDDDYYDDDYYDDCYDDCGGGWGFDFGWW